MSEKNLAIPIYLDVNTMLDLLASIDEGFSMVESIRAQYSGGSSSEISGSGGFGISNVLSVFKIDIRGAGKTSRMQDKTEERETTRYHTYGSLLNRLHEILEREGLLKEITDVVTLQAINPGDFVELRGRFVPNPLKDALQTLCRLLNMFFLFDKIGEPTANTQKQQSKEKKSEYKQMKSIGEVLDGLMKDIEPASVQTYIVELEYSDVRPRVLLSLYTDYLRDRAGYELPYGEFRVLGKVTRVVRDEDQIDLLKNSALSGVSEELLEGILDAVRDTGEQGIKIPELYTKVAAPALQIIPVSIYV